MFHEVFFMKVYKSYIEQLITAHNFYNSQMVRYIIMECGE
jgi:hypothetical protein